MNVFLMPIHAHVKLISEACHAVKPEPLSSPRCDFLLPHVADTDKQLFVNVHVPYFIHPSPHYNVCSVTRVGLPSCGHQYYRPSNASLTLFGRKRIPDHSGNLGRNLWRKQICHVT